VPLNSYLRLKGQKTGEIRGSVTQKGREGRILVHAAAHGVTSPRDAASGQASGKRAHKPFVVSKGIDRSSPLLYGALVAQETMVEWELQFWRVATTGTGGAGSEHQHYTVTLTNAVISSIEFRMPDTKNPASAQMDAFEEVAFTYQKIQWTWTDGGVTATDSWSGPV